MRLFGKVNSSVDRYDRAEWISMPFDLAFTQSGLHIYTMTPSTGVDLTLTPSTMSDLTMTPSTGVDLTMEPS